MAIDESKLPIGTNWILRTMPRGRDYPTPIPHACNIPFYTLLVNKNGDCWVCRCEAWLPLSVGNILDFEKLEDIWTSPMARELQQDVQAKKYTYCAVDHCGVANHEVWLGKYQISINMDESCNLACPSCRRDIIHHKSGPFFDKMTARVEHLVKLIEGFDKPVTLTMSGNGDVLASLIMRPLFLSWQPRVNQNIIMFTNGLLIKKMLPDSLIWPHIVKFKISVDAGSADVYEIVRRPGKFWALQENLDWLAHHRRPDVEVELQFCISAPNAADIVNFAEMCRHYGFHGNISQLDNIDTFDDFDSQDAIGNANHPMHKTALTQLREVRELSYIHMSGVLLKILKDQA
jgi:MoaA/NifB/PqqE/SkfB family radical SAM enzyme